MTLAQKTDLPTAPDHHLQVISRAALLLRIASGSCLFLLRSANTPMGQTVFWWSQLGERRGMWHSKKEPADVNDLWTDVEQALDDLEHLSGGLRPSEGLMVPRTAKPFEIGLLGECERIALYC